MNNDHMQQAEKELSEDHSIYEIGTANDDFSAAAYVVCEDVKWG